MRFITIILGVMLFFCVVAADNDPKECPLEHTEWKECVTCCDSCECRLQAKTACTNVCTPGCQCKTDYGRVDTKCIPIAECIPISRLSSNPPAVVAPVCGQNEVLLTEGNLPQCEDSCPGIVCREELRPVPQRGVCVCAENFIRIRRDWRNHCVPVAVHCHRDPPRIAFTVNSLQPTLT